MKTHSSVAMQPRYWFVGALPCLLFFGCGSDSEGTPYPAAESGLGGTSASTGGATSSGAQPAVVTGGNVRVGRFSALSLASAVIHGRSVGSHTVVGAGALVLQDIPGHSVAWGTPARVIRQRKEGERYL